METVELIEDESENELESDREDKVVVIEKKIKTVSAKQKKWTTEYLAQVTNEELLEHSEQSEANEANLA